MDLTATCRDREEYEAARLEWLERAIGFDTSYVGAATPEAATAVPAVSGMNANAVARCEAHADRYWQDRLALNGAALRAGGVVCDYEALSAQTLDRMVFYREVVSGHGIRATAVSVLRTQGQVVGCLYLGRTSRSARFGDEVEHLRHALPALSLGKRLFDLSPRGARATAGRELPFTARETDVLSYLVRGLTNGEIASLLGTSRYTVKNQVATMLAKASVKNRTELVYLATRTSDESPKPEPAAK
jgi:DNA-binding CsgD family transcriptional regulator